MRWAFAVRVGGNRGAHGPSAALGQCSEAAAGRLVLRKAPHTAATRSVRRALLWAPLTTDKLEQTKLRERELKEAHKAEIAKQKAAREEVGASRMWCLARVIEAEEDTSS